MVMIIETLKQRLTHQGFDGLYCTTRACSCQVQDLMHCGRRPLTTDGEIAGCKPGYKHFDPRDHELYGRRFKDWAIFPSKNEPAFEEWYRLSSGVRSVPAIAGGAS